jgi:FkbM family methyltransferase
MKNLLRYILQKVLGFNNYLFLFSVTTIKRLLNNQIEPEFRHFLTMIPDEGIILDIGANIGITTVPLGLRKINAKIYSFEPMPENVKALRRSVGYFKLQNVEVFETALGDTSGEVTMITPVINSVKMQGLSHIKSPENPSNGSEINVQVQKLDDMPELSSAINISAIKIDVENFEYYVLKGAEKLLAKHKPIIYCELWKNEKRDLTIELLKNLGYDLKIYNNGNLIDPDQSDTINFFFLPVK